MKTVDEVRKRLEKLRFRCLRQHVRLISSKKPQNCVHNFEHVPHPQRNEIPTEVEMVPRVVSTLVVIQPEKPIRLCMYGSDKPESWNGDICDVDDTAQICPYFKSRVSEERAVEEFDLLMVDDDYVFEHHKDIATLQWVLGERIHRTPLTKMRLSAAVRPTCSLRPGRKSLIRSHCVSLNSYRLDISPLQQQQTKLQSVYVDTA